MRIHHWLVVTASLALACEVPEDLEDLEADEQAASATTAVVYDSFQRPAAQGWGRAETGGTYAVSPSSAFSLTGSAGQLTMTAQNQWRSALLPSVSARDVDASVRVSTSTTCATRGGDASLFARYRDAGNYYRAVIVFHETKAMTQDVLTVELAEGFAERMHQEIRDQWGFPDATDFSMRDRLLEANLFECGEPNRNDSAP